LVGDARQPLRLGDVTTRVILYKFNQMVKPRPLDRTFSALADPTRRDILERLGRGPATLTELADPFDMTVPGVLKHVRILEAAELVTTERVGRTRECRLGPDQLDEVAQWIEGYRRRWERRLDRLEAYVERRQGEQT
jgi:DNA-binding transcriptional ArsR family regulator